MNINSALFRTGSWQKLFQSHKNICFGAIQDEGKLDRGLNSGPHDFLVTENCQPNEISRGMYVIYVEEYFSKKMFTSGDWVIKTIHEV